MQYVSDHPILGKGEAKELTIFFDGKPVKGYEGQTVAAILMENGVRTFRYTAKRREPRGLYCGIGQCTDCIMIIDGVPNTKACMTFAKEGMRTETQHGNGKTVDAGRENADERV